MNSDWQPTKHRFSLIFWVTHETFSMNEFGVLIEILSTNCFTVKTSSLLNLSLLACTDCRLVLSSHIAWCVRNLEQESMESCNSSVHAPIILLIDSNTIIALHFSGFGTKIEIFAIDCLFTKYRIKNLWQTTAKYESVSFWLGLHFHIPKSQGSSYDQFDICLALKCYTLVSCVYLLLSV